MSLSWEWKYGTLKKFFVDLEEKHIEMQQRISKQKIKLQYLTDQRQVLTDKYASIRMRKKKMMNCVPATVQQFYCLESKEHTRKLFPQKSRKELKQQVKRQWKKLPKEDHIKWGEKFEKYKRLRQVKATRDTHSSIGIKTKEAKATPKRKVKKARLAESANNLVDKKGSDVIRTNPIHGVVQKQEKIKKSIPYTNPTKHFLAKAIKERAMKAVIATENQKAPIEMTSNLVTEGSAKKLCPDDLVAAGDISSDDDDAESDDSLEELRTGAFM